MQKPKRREKRRPESRCPECVNAIFDENWGEYKCKTLKRRIRRPEDNTGCKNYKKAE